MAKVLKCFQKQPKKITFFLLGDLFQRDPMENFIIHAVFSIIKVLILSSTAGFRANVMDIGNSYPDRVSSKTAISAKRVYNFV